MADPSIEARMYLRERLFRAATAALCMMLLAGCAQTPTRPAEPYDPIEPANRQVFAFNDTLDTYILRPVANGYAYVTPAFFRRGVDNFFTNLGYPGVVLNNFLQGKVQRGFQDLIRFGVNSTIGFAGVLDPASTMGLPNHKEDFGQTLGVWGVEPGAYLVIPALGSSDARDVTSYPASYYTNVTAYVGDPVTTTALYVVNYINKRALLEKASKIRSQASIDPYAFTRSAYLQYRRNLVYDGNPPLQYDEQDFFKQMEQDGTAPPGGDGSGGGS